MDYFQFISLRFANNYLLKLWVLIATKGSSFNPNHTGCCAKRMHNERFFQKNEQFTHSLIFGERPEWVQYFIVKVG